MRKRDSQRSKLYRAESAIPVGQRLETVAEIEEYIDSIMRKAWFKRRWPRVAAGGIRVKDGRGTRNAHGNWHWSTGGYINIPRWARTEDVVLHELTHVITTQEYRDSVAWHGPEYAYNLLQLVQWKMGKEVGQALRQSYKEKRVKWHRMNGHRRSSG